MIHEVFENRLLADHCVKPSFNLRSSAVICGSQLDHLAVEAFRKATGGHLHRGGGGSPPSAPHFCARPPRYSLPVAIDLCLIVVVVRERGIDLRQAEVVKLCDPSATPRSQPLVEIGSGIVSFRKPPIRHIDQGISPFSRSGSLTDSTEGAKYKSFRKCTQAALSLHCRKICRKSGITQTWNGDQR